MNTTDAIAVTGAAGFIGSYLTGFLNKAGFNNLYLVDDFSVDSKQNNLRGKQFAQKIERDVFPDWLKNNKGVIRYIFHLGARTDTTEMDYSIHKRLNLDYTKDIWQICVEQNIPLVYASSAATYGNGELGYKDDHNIVSSLKPLNPYGISKNEFDIWALQQTTAPPFWAGVKFFNVYGPNEYHKGRMASVIFHAYRQINETGKARLFRSHNPAYKDGEQMRDFIYVEDIVKICVWLMENKPENGLYNAGTGNARTFNDLINAIFASTGRENNIEYIDTPLDIRDKYQYFTEADMTKLRNVGYKDSFNSLEAGISNYINHYLNKGLYF